MELIGAGFIAFLFGTVVLEWKLIALGLIFIALGACLPRRRIVP